MKFATIILLGITLCFASCKDSETNSNQDSVSEENTDSELNSEKSKESNIYSQDNNLSKETPTPESNVNSETINSPNIDDKTKPNSENANLSGTYIKLGEEVDSSCTCYCVTINYTGNSEMCLTPSKIFINTRMQKKDKNTTDIFLINPSAKNTEGKDIPWTKFDTNKPIATITTKENGEIDLDWLGFSINGDLAIDYAILGKKTLEGNYKKK